MPTTVHAFGAHEAGQPLAPVTIERRDVGPHDVRLDILYCGICHSDMNFVDGSFGPLPVSPLVPGHEIVGRVTATGSDVTRHYIPELLQRILDGAINPGRVFDYSTDLDHVADAYAAMDERRAIKSLLTVSQP